MAEKDSIDYQYISRQEQADALAVELSGAGKIALDVEADSFYHYSQKVCLIQLSFGSTNVIVDPLTGLNLSGLMSVLSEKELVLHDSGYDLRMLKKDFEFAPRGQICDTMLAGRLLGLSRLGLEAMLSDILGVGISKVSQRADWSRRPLDGDLLLYAASDTHHLLYLWAALQKRLDALGRLEWHRQCCRQAVSAAMEPPRTADRDLQWRIKGSSVLSPRQLEFLRVLWYWRDGQAQKADVPAFRIFGNEQLLSLAIRAWSQEKLSIETLGRLPRNIRGSRLRSLANALGKAWASGPDDWPGQLKAAISRRPEITILRRIEYLKDKCRLAAEQLGISPDVLASRAVLAKIAAGTGGDIERLVANGLLMRWQADILAEAVAAAFGRQRSGYNAADEHQ